MTLQEGALPPVLVAVSGGADSVAAAHLLGSSGRPFVVAHFDHHLRPESGEDAAFVERLAAGLGARYLHGEADVAAVAKLRGWNVEDAARRLRYAFLHRALKESGAEWIVVAHTADDQAETLLLQLLRGAAFPRGMEARRGAVVRPLLAERRRTLRDYLAGEGRPWREDVTNLDVSRDRAWLRQVVLPAFEGRFPGVTARLAHTAGTLTAARSALAAEAARRFGTEGALETRALAAAPDAVRHLAYAGRLAAASVPVSARLVRALDEAVLASAAGGTAAPPWRRDVGKGIRATVAYGRLSFAPAPPREAEEPPVVPVTSPAHLPEGVDPQVLEGRPGLVLRRRRPGDRIALPGGSKLVSDLLIDAKVAREERDLLRVLADGREVLWVEGVATAAPAATGADEDAAFMRLALEEARRALEAGEVPVGAVVVVEGRVVAAAHNRTEETGDPTAHAELLALADAARATGDWRLGGATLYVTLEPCPMCLGAVLQTHLARLVYGARNRREGALGSVVDLTLGPWKRLPEVRGGVEAAAAGELLRRAFAAAREGATADGPGA